jgi:hypothetical protein
LYLFGNAVGGLSLVVSPQKTTRSSGYTVARIHLATSAGIDWLIDVSRTAIYWNKGPSNGLIGFDAKITAAR